MALREPYEEGDGMVHQDRRSHSSDAKDCFGVLIPLTGSPDCRTGDPIKCAWQTNPMANLG